jgi:hypothetical protein
MAVDFAGTWKNQNESRLELTVLGGVVFGRFESGVGDDNQPLWVEVSGRVLDDVITFNAVYVQYGTVVAWVGQHTDGDGRGKINTQWLHATNIPDNQEQKWMWFTNRTGADVFTRV